MSYGLTSALRSKRSFSTLDAESEETEAESRAKGIAVVHTHCGVYTQPRVAEAILDRIGWVGSADLRSRSLLEPACGDGAFLLPAVRRLLDSARRLRWCNEMALAGSIAAFEFDRKTATALRRELRKVLVDAGLEVGAAARLALSWLRCEDFLLARDLPAFSDVVGNPPYMRWSKIPATLKSAYEEKLPRHAARGDLCLAFICRCVELLDLNEGRVAFLCADRWLRCAYGAEARVELERVTRLALHLEVHDVPVFIHGRVGAYAAITVLDRVRQGEAVIARASSMDDLCRRLLPGAGRATASHAHRITGKGGAVLANSDLTAAFSAMHRSSSTLSDAGIEVRCGMALGCAPVFIIEGKSEIEKSRLTPWVRTRDLLESGIVQPSARVLNVWDEEGKLVDLKVFPKLKTHLEQHRPALKKRACVTRNTGEWYRTIDRLDLDRLKAPKILVAGMSKFARVALSSGGAQPSNALYSITSTQWPLRALFALLRIGTLDVFGTVLSPRFFGGVKRFDGNLLRQIRVPLWSDIEQSIRDTLLEVDVSVPTPRPELVARVYGLTVASHLNALAKSMARD